MSESHHITLSDCKLVETVFMFNQIESQVVLRKPSENWSYLKQKDMENGTNNGVLEVRGKIRKMKGNSVDIE